MRKLFTSSFVSLTRPAQLTYTEAVRMIAQNIQQPFAIESLDKQLDTGKLPRAGAYFGVLGGDKTVVDSSSADGLEALTELRRSLPHRLRPTPGSA